MAGPRVIKALSCVSVSLLWPPLMQAGPMPCGVQEAGLPPPPPQPAGGAALLLRAHELRDGLLQRTVLFRGLPHPLRSLVCAMRCSFSPAQCSGVQYSVSVARYSAANHSTVQESTTVYSTAWYQCSGVQHGVGAVQCSTVQCSTV